MSMRRTRVHVNLPHVAHAHHHVAREHFAHIPAPSFKMTPIKRYRLAKKPDNKGEERLLLVRNPCVAAAAALFLLAMVPEALSHHLKYIVRGVAYIFGAGAYGSEMMMLTDNFKHMHPFREMFMPYAFGVLYVLMSISYFLEA